MVTNANPMVAPAARVPEFDPEPLMDLHRKMVKQGQYLFLGKLEKVMLESDAIANVSGNPLARRAPAGVTPASASIDWMGLGPRVALSLDRFDLLALSPAFKPPALPDPAWTPPANWFVPKRLGGMGRRAAPRAPEVEQRLRDRAAGVHTTSDGRRWLAFHPVHQVQVILPKEDRGGGMCLLSCRPLDGRYKTLLFHPESGQAFFLFGSMEADFLY